MSDREETIFNTALEFLSGEHRPQAEPMIQAHVQTRLGIAITVNELSAALQLANQKGYATGLPGANERVRWSIADAGRHYLANR